MAADDAEAQQAVRSRAARFGGDLLDHLPLAGKSRHTHCHARAHTHHTTHQETYKGNAYCKLFMLLLSGDIPRDTYQHFRKDSLVVIRNLFEMVDSTCMQSVEPYQLAAAMRKHLVSGKVLGDHQVLTSLCV